MCQQPIALRKNDNIADANVVCTELDQHPGIAPDQWPHTNAVRYDPRAASMPAVILEDRPAGLVQPALLLLNHGASPATLSAHPGLVRARRPAAAHRRPHPAAGQSAPARHRNRPTPPRCRAATRASSPPPGWARAPDLPAAGAVHPAAAHSALGPPTP